MALTSSKIQQLIDAIEDANVETRKSIKAKLAAAGPEAVDALIAAVKTEQGKKCYVAAQILGEIDDPRTLKPLIRAICSKNVLLGQSALRVLGTMNNSRAIDAVVAALSDSRSLIQLRAVETLGAMNTHQAVEPLLELLQRTPSSTLRYTIIDALGNLGDSRVLPAILPFGSDKDHHVRAKLRRVVTELTASETRLDLQQNPLKDKHIYILEDDISKVYDMLVLLQQHGASVEVDWWSKGEKAKLLQAIPIDIIILDLILPSEHNDYNIFDEIRILPELARIPIVAISAVAPSIGIPEAQKKGYSGFIHKPIHDDLFPEQLKVIMSGEQIWCSE